MNTTIKYALTFASGAAIGSVAAWQLLKKKYERFAQEQINSVKEVFSRRKDVSNEDLGVLRKSGPTPWGEENVAEEKPYIDEYTQALNRLGYARESDVNKNEEKEEPSMDAPYVIPPEEFGEFEDYEKIDLKYFADGVLTDDTNEPVDDVDDIVGLDSLNHFGEYEPDSVHVRNDRLRCDYEILKDSRNHSDIINMWDH